jgi:hypothetical protein
VVVEFKISFLEKHKNDPARLCLKSLYDKMNYLNRAIPLHWRERKMVKNNLTLEQKEFAQQIGEALDQDKGIWYNKSC